MLCIWFVFNWDPKRWFNASFSIEHMSRRQAAIPLMAAMATNGHWLQRRTTECCVLNASPVTEHSFADILSQLIFSRSEKSYIKSYVISLLSTNFLYKIHLSLEALLKELSPNKTVDKSHKGLALSSLTSTDVSDGQSFQIVIAYQYIVCLSIPLSFHRTVWAINTVEVISR